ncbi:cysteine desulfurase family protein [Leucobacter sp. USHLN153]|uniref:cysteine desulfurase family protein n=1 Tax=Leucobacter sp. USHLN153 TaxID=3081268 RepID=UPI003017BF11
MDAAVERQVGTGPGANAEDGGWYLDAAATAPLRSEARAAMLEVLAGDAANASSVHQAGYRARVTLDRARSDIAVSFGARESDLVFTSGGTEANNLAIIGLALARPRGRHIVTTPIEHPSVLESCRYLERVFGFDLDFAPVDPGGRVLIEPFERLLRDDTTLVSVGLANAEVGTVQDVPRLAAAARARGALVHSDAVQAAPSLPVEFGREPGGDEWPGLGVDALSVAAHKFGGPQGAGALFVRGGLALEPLLHGGGQEGGRRSGTENVAAIAGFAAAVRASRENVGRRAAEVMASRDALVTRVLAAIPSARLTGDPEERLPGHASFVFPGVSGESLLVALDAAGVAASSGSACAAGHDGPSEALLALGMPAELADTAVRFTLPGPIPEPVVERIVRVISAEVEAGGLMRRPQPGAGGSA